MEGQKKEERSLDSLTTRTTVLGCLRTLCRRPHLDFLLKIGNGGISLYLCSFWSTFPERTPSRKQQLLFCHHEYPRAGLCWHWHWHCWSVQPCVPVHTATTCLSLYKSSWSSQSSDQGQTLCGQQQGTNTGLYHEGASKFSTPSTTQNSCFYFVPSNCRCWDAHRSSPVRDAQNSNERNLLLHSLLLV